MVFKEEETYVGYSPELDVSSCGRTQQEAKKNLHQAIQLFIEETRETGSLEDILAEAGYVRDGEQWRPPSLVSTEKTELKTAA